MSTAPLIESASAVPPASVVVPAEVSFPVVGMTCASCSNRIERFLKKTPGVEDATVNLATEVATIRYVPEQAGTAELVGAIEAAGYDVRSVPDPAVAVDPLAEATDEESLERARDEFAETDPDDRQQRPTTQQLHTLTPMHRPCRSKATAVGGHGACSSRWVNVARQKTP